MGLFKKAADQKAASEARQEHNARFNNRNTDPNSTEYLASHDRVVAAEKKARRSS
jgi:hypothetical protein